MRAEAEAEAEYRAENGSPSHERWLPPFHRPSPFCGGDAARGALRATGDKEEELPLGLIASSTRCERVRGLGLEEVRGLRCKWRDF